MSVVLWILLAFAFLILFGSYLVYRLCFHSPNKTQNDPFSILEGEQYEACREESLFLIKAMLEEPCEWVETRSFDGLKLVGRYYPSEKENAPTAICFHGYRGSDIRDFCGGYLLPRKRGYNTLVIEERGCLKSEGHTITFGIKEKEDLLCWVDYINKKNGDDKPIYLIGISMGAATVIMATALNLPENVRGVIADCPYSSPYDIIRKVAVEDSHLPSPVMALVTLAAKLWGHFSLKTKSAAEAVRETKIPVLIIHGLDDRFVPEYMSKEIQDANPSMVRRETFPEAGHGLSYMVDRERYWRVVNEFLDDVGKPGQK